MIRSYEAYGEFRGALSAPFCPLRGHFPRRGNLPIPRGSISSHSFAEKSAKVFFENDDGTDDLSVPSFLRAPGMGDNLVVKVHYGLDSRNR